MPLSTPIGTATIISEVYMPLNTPLGMVINNEKLKYHQYFGIIVTKRVGLLLLGWLMGQ